MKNKTVDYGDYIVMSTPLGGPSILYTYEVYSGNPLGWEPLDKCVLATPDAHDTVVWAYRLYAQR